MIFYNIESNEYPRHQGDLELLGWKVGDPLPENWVEVEYVAPKELDVLEICSPAPLPVLIDGVWKTAWNYRFLTEEEIAIVEEQQNL
jgi:hypothetical protein